MQSQTHMPTTVYVIDTCCKLSNAGALQGFPKTTDPNLSAAVLFQEDTQNCVTCKPILDFPTNICKTGLNCNPTLGFQQSISKLVWQAFENCISTSISKLHAVAVLEPIRAVCGCFVLVVLWLWGTFKGMCGKVGDNHHELTKNWKPWWFFTQIIPKNAKR